MYYVRAHDIEFFFYLLRLGSGELTGRGGGIASLVTSPEDRVVGFRTVHQPASRTALYFMSSIQSVQRTKTCVIKGPPRCPVPTGSISPLFCIYRSNLPAVLFQHVQSPRCLGPTGSVSSLFVLKGPISPLSCSNRSYIPVVLFQKDQSPVELFQYCRSNLPLFCSNLPAVLF